MKVVDLTTTDRLIEKPRVQKIPFSLTNSNELSGHSLLAPKRIPQSAKP